VVNTEFAESSAALSPDGRWIAYDSNESGGLEVYVQPFPTGPRTRISTASGMSPYWTADGKTIVYVTQTRVFTAADVSFANGQVQVGQPRALFDSPRRGASPRNYTFDPVRRRFLIPISPNAEQEAPITVITNWTNKLRR
jgi:serine/threonine-protein kinase